MKRLLAVMAACALSFSSLSLPVSRASEHIDSLEELQQLPEFQALTEEEQADFFEYIESDDQFDYEIEDIEVTDEADAERLAIMSRFKSRTSNPHVQEDPRVGFLYTDKPWFKYSFCTAGYIGKGFWITAEHCVHNNEGAVGFIAQPNKTFAGIEGIWVPNRNHDIAIVKVGSGLNATSFNLSRVKPAIDQVVTINGFGKGNLEFTNLYRASQVEYTVKETDKSASYEERGLTYSNISIGNQKGEYRTLGGDSGAPVWTGNTIFAVHSGSGDGGSRGLFANVNEDVDWIQKFINDYRGPSLGNRFRSWRGGLKAESLLSKGVWGSS